MNKLLQILTTLLFIFGLQQNLFGQNKPIHIKEKPVRYVSINTSACCNHCKDRLEFELIYTKGIMDASFNKQSERIAVKFKTKKITEEKIREIISELGYDADEVKAGILSLNKLEAYCKSIGTDLANNK
ncbi:heavy-metal-associated domain-containing protein [Chondrinema litorale]|uniref:heavy-metal-associated domain-containing protein n=1 Tax=Chondrinema litorale TaxID=2994555 RepID=UPI002542DAB6|nr:heavy-metal-associated domain-containing protein [Chondrinema litorale]UZR99575.1 heavy-metal-associated domain-containing protein [Chondrinema litorale]